MRKLILTIINASLPEPTYLHTYLQGCLWPVWQVACLTSDRCDKWPVWQVACLTSGLSDKWPVWQVTCLTSGLFEKWPLWQVTGVTSDLSDKWPVWEVRCLEVGPDGYRYLSLVWLWEPSRPLEKVLKTSSLSQVIVDNLNGEPPKRSAVTEALKSISEVSRAK